MKKLKVERNVYDEVWWPDSPCVKGAYAKLKNGQLEVFQFSIKGESNNRFSSFKLSKGNESLAQLRDVINELCDFINKHDRQEEVKEPKRMIRAEEL